MDAQPRRLARGVELELDAVAGKAAQLARQAAPRFQFVALARQRQHQPQLLGRDLGDRTSTLELVVAGQPLQAAIEEPRINSNHFHNSFSVKKDEPGVLEIENRVPAAVRAGLAARGHRLAVLGPYGVSTGVVAAGVVPGTGTLRGAPDGRRERYVCGW